MWSLLMLTAFAVTPDDSFTLRSAQSPSASADGRVVAWLERRWDEEADRRVADLWSTGPRRSPTRITFTNENEGTPVVSPDGDWIYYLSSVSGGDRPPLNGVRQVWRIPAEGGTAQPITSSSERIDAFELSADGQSVWYTVRDTQPIDDPFASLRSEHKGPDYQSGPTVVHSLHRIDLTSWRSEVILSPTRTIGELAVAPDGERVAMLTRPDHPLLFNEGWSRVDILDVKTGEVTSLPDTLWRDEAPSPYGWLLGLAWDDQGDTLAFRVDFDGYPGELFLASFDDGAHQQTVRLPRSGDWTLVGGQLDFFGNRICYRAAERSRIRVQCSTPSGNLTVLTPGDRVVWSYHLGRRGLITSESGPGVTGELFRWTGRAPKPITDTNPQVDDWSLPQLREVTWTAKDGVEVQGILELPPWWTPVDGPLPTLIQIHGGPTAASVWGHSFSRRSVFAARGWAVLSPNYRGSTGFGDAFVTDLIGNENDIDVTDILSGVDHLVEQGIANPNQLAVMGWSNGGFLTNCLITRTDRFKAASSGAGVFDQSLQWATEDTPGHVINFIEGLPWEVPDETRAASPLFQADQIRTPTVIHVGENDPRVPPVHARALYRALQHYVDVPTELLIYPGEGHGLGRLSHRKAKLAWDMAWFDHWVLGIDDTDE